MSDKTICPACDCYSSYHVRGKDCPNCGLSAEIAFELEIARKRGADNELIEKLAKMSMEFEKQAEKIRQLSCMIAAVQDALDSDYSNDAFDVWND